MLANLPPKNISVIRLTKNYQAHFYFFGAGFPNIRSHTPTVARENIKHKTHKQYRKLKKVVDFSCITKDFSYQALVHMSVSLESFMM
jgi:hypothetical protein